MLRTFGRLIEFDDRSRKFPIRALIPQVSVPRSYTWSCGIWLDQEKAPACTGFAVAHEAAARPVIVPGINNVSGLSLYRRAKQLDQWPGEGYEGSSVLGAMKAGVECGWYSEYRWAFSEMDLRLAVGYKGPAVLGISWYSEMSSPDGNGIIEPLGGFLGGHAILCNGVNIKKRLYRLHNSWGKSWGRSGECFISFEDMEELLKEEGEACIPIKRLLPKA